MSEYMQRKQPNAFTQPKAKSNQYSTQQTREAQLRELEYNLRPRAQNQTVQKKEDEETKTETGETTTADQTIYFVTKGNANVRSNDEKHKVKSDLIPQGLKVYVINTSTDEDNKPVSQIQSANDPTTTYWTTSTNISEVTSVTDDNYYTAFYNDIEILEAPSLTKSTGKLIAGAEYKLLSSCQILKPKQTFY